MEGSTFSRAGSHILGKSESVMNFKSKDLFGARNAMTIDTSPDKHMIDLTSTSNLRKHSFFTSNNYVYR